MKVHQLKQGDLFTPSYDDNHVFEYIGVSKIDTSVAIVRNVLTFDTMENRWKLDRNLCNQDFNLYGDVNLVTYKVTRTSIR